MNAFACLVAACFIPDVEGNNLLMNKPSKQSSTYRGLDASYAVDGDHSTYSTTYSGLSFWQGDLQGYFLIENISVSSSGPFGHYIENALIGVSVNDVTCPNNEVIKCGQWPGAPFWATSTFTCNHTEPVRFVRVYKDTKANLNVAEVTAQGIPTNTLTGIAFQQIKSVVVSSNSSALITEDSIDCANACFYGQPCVAYSFSDTVSPNCLLASSVSATSSTEWSTYKIKDCSVKHC